MRKIVLVMILAATTGCATTVTTAPADCMAFVPPAWRMAVPGAPLPADESAAEWQKFGVAQSGQLSKANGRVDDIFHIVGACEQRANAARPRKRFLGL